MNMRSIKKFQQAIIQLITFRRIRVISLLLLLPVLVISQSLTLETCQQKAKANYPLVKQYGLIEQTSQYNISNANKGYLPQLSLSARGTYQSDVTALPPFLAPKDAKGNSIPIPPMDKDQYQAVLEASQLIWDGGVIEAQKKITSVSTDVEKKKLEVDLYALNERIDQLFFGILLINEQVKQTEILENELLTNYNRISALKQNGLANQSDLDAIKVEQINVSQRKSELKSTQKSFYIMLSAFTGMSVNDKTIIEKPELDISVMNQTKNNRPELALFEAQSKLIEGQKDLLNAGNLPKIGAFLQGGYGKPGLNMLTNEFSAFYIGGIRLSWNFSGYYTQKNNVNKLDINKKTVDIQKETFLFNTDLKTKQQQTEIEKIQSILTSDVEIIRLRENIKIAATAKVDNGTLTVSDLIREINAESQARQLKSLHEIQLLMAIYQLKNNTNY
jgi:outer membrane protein TolC